MSFKNFPKRLDSKTSCLRITVPENLDLALEGLIRKVLREQPKTDDIHSFAADYFETLLRIRDKAGTKHTHEHSCPFHNDEDAHEMIKLASSFNKPEERKGREGLPVKGRAVERGKRGEGKGHGGGARRPKAERGDSLRGGVKSNESKEPSKQETPDLIKKLPRGSGGAGEKKEEPSGSEGMKRGLGGEMMREGRGSEEERTSGTGSESEEREREGVGEMEKEDEVRKADESVGKDAGRETTRTEATGDKERIQEIETVVRERSKSAEKISEEAVGKGYTEEEPIPTSKAKEGSEEEEEKDKHPVDESNKIEANTLESKTDTKTVRDESAEILRNGAREEEDDNSRNNGMTAEKGNLENDTETILIEEKVESVARADTDTLPPHLRMVEDEDDKELDEKAGDRKAEEESPDNDVKSETAVEEEVKEAPLLLEKPDDYKGVEKDDESNKEQNLSTKATEPAADPENEEKKSENEKVVTSENIIVRRPDEDATPGKEDKEKTEPHSDRENPNDIKNEEENKPKSSDEGTSAKTSKEKEDIGEEEPRENETKAEFPEWAEEVISPSKTIPEAPEMEADDNELCTVVDIQHIPETDKEKSTEEPHQETTQKEAEEWSELVDSEHVIRVEEPEEGNENSEVTQPSEEVQIKTIQTHYYDTLQVPKTVTKELKVHNVTDTPPLNVPPLPKTTTEATSASPPTEEWTEEPHPKKVSPLKPDTAAEGKPETPEPGQEKQNYVPLRVELNRRNLGSDSQTSETDDLSDLTTPTSGYSLNLSELSWQTISGMFLDSERQHSSLEKENMRFATPKRSEGGRRAEEGRVEVKEIFHKTELPSGVRAVPVFPGDAEEAKEESDEKMEKGKEKAREENVGRESAEETRGGEENVGEDKAGEEEAGKESGGGEFLGTSSEGDSSNGKDINGDAPLVCVEVKTVIENEVVEEDESLPQVEVKVAVEVEDAEERRGEEKCKKEGKKESVGEGGEGGRRAGGQAGGGGGGGGGRGGGGSGEGAADGEGSSGESDSTTSSAATEIKRNESSREHVGTGRSLLTSQSLDNHDKGSGGRNPLLRARSLSTFRHGVTDFEVWNAIEKELEEAATKIQSRFRRYKTRKKLQRENAVHITTEESSPSTTPAETDQSQCGTGEFHDSIVLSEHPR